MMIRYRLLIGLLVAANLTVAGFIFTRPHESANESSSEMKKPERLPQVKLRDDAGKELGTDTFAGKPLFIQFINPHVQAQVDSYLHAREGQFEQPVSWLLISKDANELRKRLPSENRDVIVENDYEKLRDLFGVAKCCEEWLLYDRVGSLKASGKYDQDDTVSRLKHVVDGESPFSTNVLLKAFESMNERGLLRQLHAKAAHSRSGKAVAALFSSACTGCPEDYLIHMLSTQAGRHSKVGFLALLPNTFNQSDVNSFKINLEVPFAVELAEGGLSNEWLRMNEKYGAKSINGSIVAVRRGRIISVANGLNETKHLLEDLAGHR